MSRERPELGDKTPAALAAELRREALDFLDLALKAHGSERTWLLGTAMQLRQWAREFEEDASPD